MLDFSGVPRKLTCPLKNNDWKTDPFLGDMLVFEAVGPRWWLVLRDFLVAKNLGEEDPI